MFRPHFRVDSFITDRGTTPLLLSRRVYGVIPPASCMPVPLVTYIRDHRDQLAYVLLAELGLIVVSFVVLMAKPTYPAQTFPLRAAFALICGLGIIAGLSPAVLSFSRAERRDGEASRGTTLTAGGS